jgi:hypothetical protein
VAQRLQQPASHFRTSRIPAPDPIQPNPGKGIFASLRARRAAWRVVEDTRDDILRQLTERGHHFLSRLEEDPAGGSQLHVFVIDEDALASSGSGPKSNGLPSGDGQWWGLVIAFSAEPAISRFRLRENGNATSPQSLCRRPAQSGARDLLQAGYGRNGSTKQHGRHERRADYRVHGTTWNGADTR